MLCPLDYLCLLALLVGKYSTTSYSALCVVSSISLEGEGDGALPAIDWCCVIETLGRDGFAAREARGSSARWAADRVVPSRADSGYIQPAPGHISSGRGGEGVKVTFTSLRY